MISIDKLLSLGIGFLVCGNSGSGKTSVAKVIAGEFEGATGLILDVHGAANDWSDLGGTLCWRIPEILDWVEWLRGEYQSRKDGKRSCDRLVVIWDEFEESLAEIEAYLFEQGHSSREITRELRRITNLVRSLATGGRKFGITLLVLNQSWNVSSLKINSGHRKNFICVFLNAEVDRYLSTFGLKVDFISESGYKAICTGAVDTQEIQHPTHHTYKVVANNQVPILAPKHKLSGVTRHRKVSKEEKVLELLQQGKLNQ